MPSTTSPNLSLELQATGEDDGTWGVNLNTDLSTIDSRMGGRLALSVAGAADVTLTGTQAKNVYHNLTGVLTGNINYIFPASAGGFYIIKNATSGAFTLTAKPSGGTGIVVVQGQTMLIFIDPDQTAAVAADQPKIVTGGGLELSGGALQRSALSGDVTASAGSNTTALGITTTRGDIITRGVAVNGRLALGGTGTVLASDGTDALYRTLTALLDAVFGSTRGQVLARGAANWSVVSVGSVGTHFQSDGTDPSWTAPATAAQYRANTANKFLDTSGVWSAAGYVGLTDAATIAVDLSLGINFSLTMINNRALGNPSNTKDGQSGIIVFTQDGTGTRTLSYSGNWKFAGGTAPVLTVTIGARDILVYQVISSTVIYGSLVKDVK